MSWKRYQINPIRVKETYQKKLDYAPESYRNLEHILVLSSEDDIQKKEKKTREAKAEEDKEKPKNKKQILKAEIIQQEKLSDKINKAVKIVGDV